MKPIDPKAIQIKVHSGHILLALARYFDWFVNTMMPEWEIDGGIADLVFVTKAGYVTEIEIKTTMSDWNADRDKRKWNKPRPHIARFFYAVPESLAAIPPEWIPDWAGILAIHRGERGYPWIHEVRPAKRLKAQKLAPSVVQHMFQRCYFRFWRAELVRRRERMRL